MPPVTTPRRSIFIEPRLAYDPGNRDLVKQVQEIHETIGTIILVVVGLHVAAALAHHYVWRDKVLARMWGPPAS